MRLVNASVAFLSATSFASAATGQTVLAHHVILEGTIREVMSVRETLRRTHRVCVDLHRLTGRPIRHPVMPEVPEATPMVRETYYAADRVLEDKRFSVYTVHRADCGVDRHDRRIVRLYWSRGTCEMDYSLNEAKGQCLAEVDDGPMRPGVLPQYQGRQHRRATGEAEVIAGVPCLVYATELPAFATRACVARPESRFPLGSSTLSLGATGLLLSYETQPVGTTLRATRVSLHEQVPAGVFQVPPGMRVRR